MKKAVLNVSIFIGLVLLASCGGSDKPSNENIADSLGTTVDEETVENQILYNIPSPIETFMLLKVSGVPFDKSLVNPVDNVTKYVTSFSSAFNLGTYSTDLTFCLLYEKSYEVNLYLKNIDKLTTALHIDGDFVQTAAKRASANANNLDSISQIISEFKVNTNLYLNENQMSNTIAIMTSGAWIEAMYILTNIADKSKNKEIVGLVSDQKFTIKNLINELEKYKSDAEIAAMLAEIKDLASVFETLKSSTAAENTASKEKGMVSIGSNITYELSNEQLKLILNKITTLRNKLTL